MLNQTIVIQTPSEDLVPIVSVVITAIVSVLVTYISIKNNTKTIFIQANKDKINEKILELAQGARRGKLDEITEVVNSKDNYYIPEDLKKKISKEIKKENPPNFYYKILKNKDQLLKRLRNEKYPDLYERILSIINRS